MIKVPQGWLKPFRGACVKNIISVPLIRGEIVFWLALIQGIAGLIGSDSSVRKKPPQQLEG